MQLTKTFADAKIVPCEFLLSDLKTWVQFEVGVNIGDATGVLQTHRCNSGPP